MVYFINGTLSYSQANDIFVAKKYLLQGVSHHPEGEAGLAVAGPWDQQPKKTSISGLSSLDGAIEFKIRPAAVS